MAGNFLAITYANKEIGMYEVQPCLSPPCYPAEDVPITPGSMLQAQGLKYSREWLLKEF